MLFSNRRMSDNIAIIETMQTCHNVRDVFDRTNLTPKFESQTTKKYISVIWSSEGLLLLAVNVQ